jgi:hypothetical protein
MYDSNYKDENEDERDNETRQLVVLSLCVTMLFVNETLINERFCILNCEHFSANLVQFLFTVRI